MALTFGPGITVEQGVKMGEFSAVPSLVLSLDAATYAGSGDWIDSVGSMPFTLNGSPTWSSSIGGGSFSFDPFSSQYAESSSSLSTLASWSVEVWHYYTGLNIGTYPCIVSELWPNSPSQLNYSLGSLFTPVPNLQAGFFNLSWRTTPEGYSLTADNWYQIVGTYDGINLKLYVNGSMVTQAPMTVECNSGNSAIRLMRRWDAADYWGGRLASVKIWDGDINFEGVQGSWLENKARYGL